MKYTGYWKVICKDCKFHGLSPYKAKALDLQEEHEKKTGHKVEIKQIK